MFGFLAALYSFIPKQREGRERLIYENYIRTGQGLPKTKIYRESSVDKRTRKELAEIRYKERLQQQIKFIRLMKKLLIKANHNAEIDEELEQMRIKVSQLELKIEKAACAKNINCDDMFNMDKPDDAYDIQLETIIRNVTSNITTTTTTTENFESKYDCKAIGDNVDISYDAGDQVFVEHR
jgi:hypothetical protein